MSNEHLTPQNLYVSKTFDYLTEYTYLISGNFALFMTCIQLKRVMGPLPIFINMNMCFIFDWSKMLGWYY